MSTTIVVWVFIAYISGASGAGPMVVDNIATRENCEALAKVIEAERVATWTHTKCIAVRKIAP